jgi:hypothetical protein
MRAACASADQPRGGGAAGARYRGRLVARSERETKGLFGSAFF